MFTTSSLYGEDHSCSSTDMRGSSLRTPGSLSQVSVERIEEILFPSSQYFVFVPKQFSIGGFYGRKRSSCRTHDSPHRFV